MSTTGRQLRNSDVRAHVLKDYYDKEMRGEQGGINPEEFAKRLGVPRRQVEVALKYLVDMGLLNGTYVLGTDVPITWGITSLGMDVVDNPEKFQNRFEINQQTINISGDVSGQIAQVQGQSQVVQTANNLEDLKRLVDNHTEVPLPEKVVLKDQLQAIQQELQKDQISTKTIGKLMQPLQKYEWLYPLALDVVTKLIKKAVSLT
jgi:hypothetical protein